MVGQPGVLKRLRRVGLAEVAHVGHLDALVGDRDLDRVVWVANADRDPHRPERVVPMLLERQRRVLEVVPGRRVDQLLDGRQAGDGVGHLAVHDHPRLGLGGPDDPEGVGRVEVDRLAVLHPVVDRPPEHIGAVLQLRSRASRRLLRRARPGSSRSRNCTPGSSRCDLGSTPAHGGCPRSRRRSRCPSGPTRRPAGHGRRYCSASPDGRPSPCSAAPPRRTARTGGPARASAPRRACRPGRTGGCRAGRCGSRRRPPPRNRSRRSSRRPRRSWRD